MCGHDLCTLVNKIVNKATKIGFLSQSAPIALRLYHTNNSMYHDVDYLCRMKMYIIWGTIVLFSMSACTRKIKPGRLSEDVISDVRSIKSAPLVVRLPTQSRKIEKLTQLVQSTADSSLQSKYLEMITKAKSDDELLSQRIREAFEKYYTYSKVVFVYDTAYSKLKMGNTTFHNHKNEVINLPTLHHYDYFVIVAGSTYREELAFVTKDHARMATPLPYRKKINRFMALKQPEEFIRKQVSFFNERLNIVNTYAQLK
jgi:hypothetical protein